MFNIFKKFVLKETLLEKSEIPNSDETDIAVSEEGIDLLEQLNQKKEKDSFYYYEKHQKELKQVSAEAFKDEFVEQEDDILFELDEFAVEPEQEKAETFQEDIIDEIPEFVEQEIKKESISKGLFGISFDGLKDAVSKTSEFFNSNILSLSVGKEEIDDEMLDQMEEKLIRADIGVDTTVFIIERLRGNKNKTKPNKLAEYLKNEFKEIIKAPGSNELNLKQSQLNTFLITGVNGAGKTTLIGKLAYRFKIQGKKVLVAAGDTYRAAAEDQLEIWANRAGADIVRQDGADPASVVFDSIKKAHAEKYDVLLIDTAGRLHNKINLMEELRKIKKVIDKEAFNTLVESILVLDATTGQNGLKQAEVFKEAVDITCVGLTKLDGTAKGGVILGIARQLNLPVKLIGVGEKMEDLRDFNSDDYVDALF